MSEEKAMTVGDHYFTVDKVPRPFEAKFLKPSTVCVSFETITVDSIHIFYHWLRGHPNVFNWKAFDNTNTNFGLIVKFARLNIDKEEIPPHERELLYCKIEEILNERIYVPDSPYRLTPKGSDELIFHATNLI